MNFTTSVWKDIEPLYESIIEHPFNTELMKGILDKQKFSFYVNQDALYLADFARALSIIAGRSEDTNAVLQFSQFAESAIVVEMSLHKSFIDKFEIRMCKEKSPACFSYTNYLLSTCLLQSYEAGAASLLPCFWIYREVGNHIYANSAKNNIYEDWINTYSGEEFSTAVDNMIDIFNALADKASTITKEKMKEAVIRSTKLEYMFWDSAYRMERWVI